MWMLFVWCVSVSVSRFLSLSLSCCLSRSLAVSRVLVSLCYHLNVPLMRPSSRLSSVSALFWLIIVFRFASRTQVRERIHIAIVLQEIGVGTAPELPKASCFTIADRIAKQMLRGTQMRAICRTMRQTQGPAKAPPVAPRYVPQRSSASSPLQGAWSLSQSWLKVDGDIRPLTLETAVLQICDQDNAASAGASSVLALHCSGTAHPQWSDLAESLRRQRSDAVTRYERGGPPEAPIWSTPVIFLCSSD
jgi:hypothetical protein